MTSIFLLIYQIIFLNKKTRKTLRFHKGNINMLKYCKVNDEIEFLMTCSSDMVIIWDVKEWYMIETFSASADIGNNLNNTNNNNPDTNPTNKTYNKCSGGEFILKNHKKIISKDITTYNLYHELNKDIKEIPYYIIISTLSKNNPLLVFHYSKLIRKIPNQGICSGINKMSYNNYVLLALSIKSSEICGSYILRLVDYYTETIVYNISIGGYVDFFNSYDFEIFNNSSNTNANTDGLGIGKKEIKGVMIFTDRNGALYKQDLTKLNNTNNRESSNSNSIQKNSNNRFKSVIILDNELIIAVGKYNRINLVSLEDLSIIKTYDFEVKQIFAHKSIVYGECLFCIKNNNKMFMLR